MRPALALPSVTVRSVFRGVGLGPYPRCVVLVWRPDCCRLQPWARDKQWDTCRYGLDLLRGGPARACSASESNWAGSS